MHVKSALTAALAAVVVTACSSSTGLVENAFEGGSGQPISVAIAGVDNGMGMDGNGARQYELQVEVSNNSDLPETVTYISVDSDGDGAFQIQKAAQKFNEMIDPGKDHTFTLYLTAQLSRQFRLEESRVVKLRVVVRLANGDSYYYTFEGPVRV